MWKYLGVHDTVPQVWGMREGQGLWGSQISRGFKRPGPWKEGEDILPVQQGSGRSERHSEPPTAPPEQRGKRGTRSRGPPLRKQMGSVCPRWGWGTQQLLPRGSSSRKRSLGPPHTHTHVGTHSAHTPTYRHTCAHMHAHSRHTIYTGPAMS